MVIVWWQIHLQIRCFANAQGGPGFCELRDFALLPRWWPWHGAWAAFGRCPTGSRMRMDWRVMEVGFHHQKTGVYGWCMSNVTCSGFRQTNLRIPMDEEVVSPAMNWWINPQWDLPPSTINQSSPSYRGQLLSHPWVSDDIPTSEHSLQLQPPDTVPTRPALSFRT